MQKHAPRPPSPTYSKAREPLADGARKLYRRPKLRGPWNKRPKFFFTKMGDQELVGYARSIIAERGVCSRAGLRNVDLGLHETLRSRKLLDRVGLRATQKESRRWAAKDDEEIIAFARSLISERGIIKRADLNKTDSGLIRVLRLRGLLDSIGLDSGVCARGGPWSRMSDEQLIVSAKEFIEERGINSRWELREANRALHSALKRRGLLDETGLRSLIAHHKDWASMSDDLIAVFAMRLVRKKGIGSRTELAGLFPGLYSALRNRGLLGRVGLERKQRDWTSMSDDGLIAFAKGFISERGITTLTELMKTDSGLSRILGLRKMLGKVGLANYLAKPPRWAAMGDVELVSYAKKYVIAGGIGGRKELEEADPRLYGALRRRKLLDAIGLGRKKRDWDSMSDEELVELSRRLMAEHGIESRMRFKETDNGLYQVLKKKRLVDHIFSDIEKSKETDGVREVVKAVGEFK